MKTDASPTFFFLPSRMPLFCAWNHMWTAPPKMMVHSRPMMISTWVFAERAR